MANLTSVQSVATRLGLGDVDTVIDTSRLGQIHSAITGATLRLATLLQTGFDQATLTDRYYVDPDEKPFVDQFPKLYLKQGFIDDQASFGVKLSSIYADLTAEDDLDTEYLIRDDEKGLVMITGSSRYGVFTSPLVNWDSFYAQVTYTAGFSTKPDSDLPSYGRVYDGVPDWLQEAAIALSAYLVQQLGKCEEDEECKDPEILALVEPHIRFYPSALHPLL